MQGRCIAGKEFSQESEFGEWIRPVSNRPTQEVSEEERRYENGQDPRLLDVIVIQMIGHVPHAHQSENHVIDVDYYWSKVGTATWNDLDAAVEDPEEGLWTDGYSSYNGRNDRIPEAETLTLQSSLKLVEVDDFVVGVSVEGGTYRKRKLRARFTLAGVHYALGVTDPIQERKYLALEDGDHLVGRARLCVSIGEPYQGYCYKLVAGIITP